MTRLIRFFLIALIFPYKSVAQEKQNELYSFSLEKIANGIYVSHRPEPLRESVDGNFTVIINDNDVIVVDATVTPTGAKQAISQIRRLTAKPVKYLINTHFHGDHTFGNQEYIKAFPGIEIIATTETARVMEARVKTFKSIYSNDSLFKDRQHDADSVVNILKHDPWPGVQKIIANLKRYRDHDIYVLRNEYKNLRITPPTLTFEKELILKKGSREIRIMFLGKGDTQGDAWVFLPNEKILIAGDALPHPVPFGFTSTPVEWLKTLQIASELDFKILIPGHGAVQYDKQYMMTVIKMLESLQSQITKCIEQGYSLDQIRRAITITEFEEALTKKDKFLEYYFNEYFKVPVVERFYKDIRKIK